MMKRKSHKESSILKVWQIFLFFTTASLILFLIGIHLLSDTKSFKNSSIETTGLIIDFKEVRSTQYPIIRFSDKKGEFFEVESKHSMSNMKIGDEITVFYLPGNPQEAINSDGISEYKIAYFYIGFGLFIAFLGCYSAISTYKYNKTKKRDSAYRDKNMTSA